MGTLLYLLVIASQSLAYPQYGPVIQEEVHQEQVNQEPLWEDFAQIQKDDFTQDHVQKLQKYWWKEAGIFGGNNKDKPLDSEPGVGVGGSELGVGVGGPFTPHQSKFCETGFDCVPWELCSEGYITPKDETSLQQRTKPANYETLQCGQTGNICCGIPEDILAAHKENVEGFEIIETVPEVVVPVEEVPEVAVPEVAVLHEQEPDITVVEEYPEPIVPDIPSVVIPEHVEQNDPYDPNPVGDNIAETDTEKRFDETSAPHVIGPLPSDHLGVDAVGPLPSDHLSVDECGHQSYKCVPYFLCKDGVVVTDGAGLIDVRIRPQGVCTNSDHPDVPGVCCLKPGFEPTPPPLEGCFDNQECVEPSLCSAKGEISAEGIGGLDLRTRPKSCYRPDGSQGVCCTPPPPYVESCPGNSICSSESNCLGQALNGDNEFVAYVKNGVWTQCPYGGSNGVCCIQSTSVDLEIIEKCPRNSVCMLGNQCTGQALDKSKNFVDYITGGSWATCSLGNLYGICCGLPEPVIRESCPENSACVLGSKCTGQALDGYNNFVDYVSDGSWLTCSQGFEKGVCCKSFPSEIIDSCPGESICLKPEQCTGSALDNAKNFIDYSSQGVWSHCSQYEGGVCCLNKETPSYLQPASECGIRNYNIDERITTSNYGPNEAAFGEFPWQAIIFYQNYTYVCGATLISNKYVITAAHCVDGLHPGDIRIRFGEWQVINTDETLPYIDRNVQKIYIHSLFNPKNVHKDIAVLELYEPVEYQFHINSVCLPQHDTKIKPYTKCFATGWGKDSFEGTFQHILKKIELPYLEHQTCQDLLRKTRLGKYFRLDSSFVCAGGEENKDACYGDGGGPLVCKDEATSKYFLIGITSWGIGCGTKDVPGVYANIPSFSVWINEIMQGKHQEPLLEVKPEEHKTDFSNKQLDDQVKQEHPLPHQSGSFEPKPDIVKPQDVQSYRPQPDHPHPDPNDPFKPVVPHPDPNDPHKPVVPHPDPNDPFKSVVPQPHDEQPNEAQPHHPPIHENQPHQPQSQEHQPSDLKPQDFLPNEQQPHQPHPIDPQPHTPDIQAPQPHEEVFPDQQQKEEIHSPPISGYGK